MVKGRTTLSSQATTVCASNICPASSQSWVIDQSPTCDLARYEARDARPRKHRSVTYQCGHRLMNRTNNVAVTSVGINAPKNKY
jgi:hypothetical protein